MHSTVKPIFVARIFSACVLSACGAWLIGDENPLAFALLIAVPILLAIRSRRAALWMCFWALIIPLTTIYVLIPWSCLAWPVPFETHWKYAPNSDAFDSIILHAKGKCTKTGWFRQEEIWGYKPAESSLTRIVLTANGGSSVTATIRMHNSGEPTLEFIHADGSAEPYTSDSLKAWLQKNEIELASWRRGFDSEFSDLYFAIFAASRGVNSKPPQYSHLQNAM